MRFIIIQDYLRMGGTEKQSLFLASELIKAGHEVTLLLFRSGGALWDSMIEEKIPFKVLQKKDTKICLYAPGLCKHIKELNPDAIMCMGRTANCYSGWVQHKFKNISVIATLRTGKQILPMHYLSLRYVSAIVVNSNWWRRRLVRRGFSKDRIKLIHNPVTLYRGPENRSTWREHIRKVAGAKYDTKVFLDVAALRPGKRHTELLDAFIRYASETTDNWQLWIVGSGKEMARCKRKVHEYGISQNVIFFGQQVNTVPYYAGADIAVSASREDSLPNFLIEAQAMGLPLVAVECRGVAECCIPGLTGLIIPPDMPALFAQALQEAASSSTLIENASTHAPAFTEKKFGKDIQARLSITFMEKQARLTINRRKKSEEIPSCGNAETSSTR